MISLLIGLVALSAAENKVSVSVSGSTTVLPLGEAAAEAFNAQQQEYQVSVTGGGTGAGITGIAENRSDIAMASREVTADEKNKYGDKFQEFPVGYDGIVIVVSKPLHDAGITNLTKDQVKKIYAGEIKNWKDLGGPDAEVYVVSREQGSGTRDTFNEDIMGNRTAEVPGVNTVALGSAEVKTAVAGSDKAIGYLGYSYAEGGNVGAVALDGVKPTAESIKDGSYELARKLYFYTYGDPKPGAKAFIDFVLSPEGQRVAAENGFIPLTNVSAVATIAADEKAASPVAGKEEPSAPKAQPGFEMALAVLSMAAVSYAAIRRR